MCNDALAHFPNRLDSFCPFSVTLYSGDQRGGVKSDDLMKNADK